tara:strand:+ start:6827 stop:8425 length:1599 start_codon:yes stop_codon:yes gene_type:complete
LSQYQENTEVTLSDLGDEFGPDESDGAHPGLMGNPQNRTAARTGESYTTTQGILEQADLAEADLIKQIESASELAASDRLADHRLDELLEHTRVLKETKKEVYSLRTRVVELDKTIFAQIQRQDLSEIILSTVSDAIVTIMEDGMIRDLNNAAATLLGCDTWAGLGEPLSDFFAIPEDETPDWLMSFTHLDGLPATEASILRNDGPNIPIEFRVVCTEVEGENIGIITMHDLSRVKQTAAKLAAMHKELVGASRQAGMAEIATGILHNVGNVLNSVTVSSELIDSTAKGSVPKKLQKLVGLLESNVDDLPGFLSGGKDRKIIAYINECANRALEEQERLIRESSNMRKNVDHIRRIIARQQEHAGGGMALEQTTLEELILASYRIAKDSFEPSIIINLPRSYPHTHISIDTPRTVQIITNLIKNAAQAVSQGSRGQGTIRIGCSINKDKSFTVSVEDDGIGISEEQMKKMFGYGYTTKADGHGFGLHDAINSANTMRGSLICESPGTEQGATFLLVLPLSPNAPKVDVPPGR